MAKIRMQERVGMKEGQKVRADGEEVVMHITDQSIMFERGGKVSGIVRSAIQLIKPDGDAMLVAYSVGTEVRSVRVEPIIAVLPLLTPFESQSGPSAAQVPVSAAALDETFERMYTETRKELEERLAEVMKDSKNNDLRYGTELGGKYGEVCVQMWDLIQLRHGVDYNDDGGPLIVANLRRQPYDVQLKAAKAHHVDVLLKLTRRSSLYTYDDGGEGMWPEDWERFFIHYKLTKGPIFTDGFRSYLRSDPYDVKPPPGAPPDYNSWF